MLNTIKHLYQSETLPGDFLLQPLRLYHNFFAQKIEHCSGLRKVAWLVANAVTGIFAYPAFVLLAGIGLLVKLTGISGLKGHNESQKKGIETVRLGMIASPVYSTNASSSISRSGWKMSVIKEFRVTKQNVNHLVPAINQEVDRHTGLFMKIYASSNGFINHGAGEITVQLSVCERI